MMWIHSNQGQNSRQRVVDNAMRQPSPIQHTTSIVKEEGTGLFCPLPGGIIHYLENIPALVPDYQIFLAHKLLRHVGLEYQFFSCWPSTILITATTIYLSNIVFMSFHVFVCRIQW